MNVIDKLLSYGVSQNHIDKMKKEQIVWLQDKDPLFFLYYDCEKIEENVAIPVSKIGRTRRMTKEIKTWYNAITLPYESNRTVDLIPSRIDCCLYFIEKDGINETIERYESYLIKCAVSRYYNKDDVYFISGDCNHRTIVAKHLNVEKVIVGAVEYYCFNTKKYNQTNELKKDRRFYILHRG